METVAFLALVLFVGTNLDTLLVLIAFFLDEDYQVPEIAVGYYVGVTVGLLGAVVGALIAGELFHQWTFLLGLLPVSIGLWALRPRSVDTDLVIDPTTPEVPGRLLIVTTVSIGINGENIAAYIPFFAGLSPTTVAGIAIAYFLGAGAVFLVAFLIARQTTHNTHPS